MALRPHSILSEATEPGRNAIQPKLHPTSSTGTDVPPVQVDGKNAAAGKMAPNTAPLKGKKLTCLRYLFACQSFSSELPEIGGCGAAVPGVTRVTKPTFLPCCGQLAGPKQLHWYF